MHGKDAVVTEVVDWRPPRYVTRTGQFSGGLNVLTTDEVRPEEGGMTVIKTFKARTVEDRERVGQALAELGPDIDQWMSRLAELVSTEVAETEDVGEAGLPAYDEERRLTTAVRGEG